MDTGNCDSKMDSASNDLLSTALICVYVKSRLSNMEDNPKRESALSSSCPSIGEVNKFHSSVETDKSAQFSCSCPSLKTDILPSRNSLLSNVMEQSICWCPSAKITRSYEFHEAPADHKKNSTSVGTNTSKAAVLCSSHQKVPCCRPSQIKFSVSVQAERGKSFSTMVCPDRVSATTQCQNTTTENTHKMQPISVQVCASQKSAATQPSVLTPQFPGHESDGKKSSVCIISTRRLQTHAPIVTKKPLSIICPPACAINLPICESRLKVPRICSPLQEYIQKTISTQQSTCCADAQEETFCTNKMRKSCISLKQLISSACCKSEISSSTSPIQSKTCNMCSNLKKPFERQEDRLKTICTFSGECKQEMNAMEIEPPALSPKIFKEKKQLSCSELDIKYSSAVSSKNTTPIASKNSCNICQELAELSACDGSSYKEFKLAASKQKVNMKRPVLANLKGPKTFKQLSHLDVAAAANFIYDEGQKDDLMFITEDYQDLKSAFEKFIVTENVKNPKCKYVRKC
ncbi:hypothetical protein HHI36_014777 [Cryptolaemus montrouzieri]|uniref:Uncharacterized protein n=1 Tax=Cryptolaemus montrouzieri TaxID=559131 RepID=A0ABD2N3R1_9CUCU